MSNLRTAVQHLKRILEPHADAKDEDFAFKLLSFGELRALANAVEPPKEAQLRALLTQYIADLVTTDAHVVPAITTAAHLQDMLDTTE